MTIYSIYVSEFLSYKQTTACDQPRISSVSVTQSVPSQFVIALSSTRRKQRTFGLFNDMIDRQFLNVHIIAYRSVRGAQK